MPRIRVRNESRHPVHVGFNILGIKHPTRHCNSLQTDEAFDAGDFPSFLPQSLELRRVDGQTFQDGEAWRHGAKLATAAVAGGAAAVTGSVAMIFRNDAAMGAAGVLWTGASTAGLSYGQEAPGLVKRVSLWVGRREMDLIIRESEQGVLQVWNGTQQL